MSQDNNRTNNQYLTFRLENQQYGLPITLVREINRITEITPVPRSPQYVAGVINLRGKVIPVVDMRLKLGMPRQAPTKHTCVVVVESTVGLMGVIVDKVNSVVELKPDQVEKSPQMGNVDSSFVLGLGKLEQQVIILVDVLSLLGAEGLNEVKKTTQAA